MNWNYDILSHKKENYESLNHNYDKEKINTKKD